MDKTEVSEAKGRVTLKDKAKSSSVAPRLLSVEEAAIYTGLSVGTLRNMSGRRPVRWTKETFDAEIEKGHIPAIPVVAVSKTRTFFDLRDLDKWIDMFPRIGALPMEEEMA
ncbi:hypothetical protein AGMMS49957_01940 [Synergistales bacterium]|nr:hypothetical protein AGMMS49957_01940 [Synergistales bacterium]